MKKEKHIYTYEEFSKVNLKSMSNSELSNLANSIRKYIIEKCSINGGHLASNLGVVELTIAIHKAFNLDQDKLLFDVGHQCYTHKILTGRSLDNLRKENGVDGFIKRKESIYDHFEAGHSSTTISAAMGMALKRDLNNEHYEIISLIGDSSIANGLAMEALNNLNDFHHKIIIIINDNDMSISQPVGALHNMFQSIRLSSKYLKSKEKYRNFMHKNKFLEKIYEFTRVLKNSFKSFVLKNNLFEMFGCRYIGNVDGYDFKEMEEAFNKAKKLKQSVVIHVSTIKGKGYKLSEYGNVSSWHSVKPFDITSGKVLNSLKENEETWSHIYEELLDQELNKNKQAILINPSTLVGSELSPLFKKYKTQTFDVGIAEEHALMFGAGYGLTSSKAYISIYSTFLQRAYDQLNHDISRMNIPLTLLIDRAGLVGSDGETHQGIFDESLLMSLPNFVITMAKDKAEAKALFNLSKKINHPFAIRIPSGTTLKDNSEINITFGKWIIEKESNINNLALISFGPKINSLLEMFKDNEITIINAIFQKPFDLDILNKLLNYKNIIVYDPYAIKDGFSYHLLAKLNELNYQGKVTICAIESTFIDKGTILEQEKRCQVDLESLNNLINSIL